VVVASSDFASVFEWRRSKVVAGRYEQSQQLRRPIPCRVGCGQCNACFRVLREAVVTKAEIDPGGGQLGVVLEDSVQSRDRSGILPLADQSGGAT